MYYLITGTNVKVTGTVQLKAGISVTLKPGFTAVSGCSLKVVIDNALIVEPEKYYYVKDHLGSTRVTVDEEGNRVSYYDYDPWGMVLDGRNKNDGVSNEKYKFTGKERDVETNYDYFGARYYDPRIGRWLQVDPLADKYPEWTTYNYGIDNPIKYIDPNGKGIWDGIQGALDAVFKDVTGQDKSSISEVENIDDYKSGEFLGHLASVACGAYLEFHGAELIAGSGAGEVLSGGTLTPVMATTAAVGVAEMAGGTMLLSSSIKNWSSEGGKPKQKEVATDKTVKRPKISKDVRSAKEQLEGIEKAQSQNRKQGKANKIYSTKKSQQNMKNKLREIKSLEDSHGSSDYN